MVISTDLVDARGWWRLWQPSPAVGLSQAPLTRGLSTSSSLAMGSSTSSIVARRRWMRGVEPSGIIGHAC